MSRKYQGLIVLNPKNLEGTIEDSVSAISKDFEASGLKVEKVDQMGRRQFAYNARHLEAGHYVNYTLNGCPDSISKVQARLRLNGNVHLQHFQRLA